MAGSCGNKIAHMESTLLYEYGRYRSAALIQLRFDNKTSCLSVGISLQFHDFCCQQYHFQKLVDPFARLGRYLGKYSASSPFFRNQFVFSKFLLHSVNIGIGFIHFIYGNNDFNSCCLGMVDCLNGLGHHAVVRRNYQHCDIR